MTKLSKNTKFVNPAFAGIFDGITAYMPGITFYGIVGTYLITAALNVHFIPLPLFISIPAALALQFGRFAIVFMDFLNPTGTRSPWPGIIATLATVIALVELWFSVASTPLSANEVWAVYLFGAMLVFSGYVLEINFIAKGAEAFGMEGKVATPGALSAGVQQSQQMPQTQQPQQVQQVQTAGFPLAVSLNGNGQHQ